MTRTNRSGRLLVFCVCVLLATAVAAGAATPQELAFFENKIRPVLSKHCYKCHSVKAKKLKAGLYVDSAAGLLKGGDSGPSVVPGNLDKSLLIEAIRYTNVDMEMPPKKKLPDAVIADFEKWVKMGAPWPKEAGPKPAGGNTDTFNMAKRLAEHWAWQPIARAKPPSVKDDAWPMNNIDRFVLARLEAKGLKPAPDTDKRTWLRRATFDLTGLPPSVEEVDAFVKDRSPKAYESVVDRLLASPHYGERWARHWMDLTRYAESFGHEFDYTINNAHRYRDYLINAFNADLPYDRFVTEHIAGDLLDKPRRHPETGTNESIVGTTFWFLHEATHAPTDAQLDEADRIDNQLTVMSHTFLSLSVGCARCHDHKFDPIPTSDYYAMSGFLQSSRRQEAMLDPGGKIAASAKRLRDLKAKGDAALVASAKSAKLSGPRFGAYLMAAYEAVHGKIKPVGGAAKPVSAATADVVFEDFESGYDGWTIKGRAFGKKPAPGTLRGQQKVSGFVGKGMVNSFVGGDRSTGTMTSRPFKVEHKYIHLRVGGGNHKGGTCVNLLVGGKVVQSATGRANERLFPVTWDVGALAGKTATIQIVDNQKGGWGHVNVDHVVFSNKKGTSAALVASGGGPPVSDAVIATAAKKHGVDATKLKAWVRAMSDDQITADASHPLYGWAALAKANDAKSFARAKVDVLNKIKAAGAKATASAGDAKPLGNFDTGKLDGWFITGQAFKQTPTGMEWDPSTGGLAEPGTLHGGLYGANLQGVLRSPTFTVTPKKVHLRIKARGVQVRLIIEGYQMQPFNGLLFGGTNIKKLDTKGKFQWVEMTSKLHYGMKAYIEIIDHGDGYAVLDEAWFDGRGSVGAAETAPDVAKAVASASSASRSIFAKKLGAYWSDALGRWSAGKTTAADRKLIAWALRHGLIATGAGGLGAIKKQMDAIDRQTPRPQYVFSMTEGTPEDERIHIRGSHKRLGKVAPRLLAQAAGGTRQPPIASGSGRLDLAKRMVDPANPLTRRVIVNRLWHHLFGRGIVPSVDDFGKMGIPPSHPLLLDYLATDFSKQGWSIKTALKQMVLSRTYRMSSKPSADPKVANLDGANELLHRMRIRRLQAEAIRDQILAVSGRLDPKIGGPSVPAYLTPYQGGRGRPRSGPLDGAGRRSLYLGVRRNFLSLMMLAYDFPAPFSTMGRRSVSNVPAQALAMLNDPFVAAEAARWGKAVAARSGSASDKIKHMFVRAFAVEPTEAQLKQIQGFVAGSNDPAVWADVAHTLFNMKRFIYLN